MVMERSSITDEALPVAAHPISEIKDAVRELRHLMPDSVLVQLAEQKIEGIERAQAGDRGLCTGDTGGARLCGLRDAPAG